MKIRFLILLLIPVLYARAAPGNYDLTLFLDGAILAGTVHLPESASIGLSGNTLTVSGGEDYFVVLSLQQGTAPVQTLNGSGRD
ncbi:MAG: hypothetical protein ACP5I4_04270 [Oceanipulchritudo sp.]